jgi:hypothetical protein
MNLFFRHHYWTKGNEDEILDVDLCLHYYTVRYYPSYRAKVPSTSITNTTLLIIEYLQKGFKIYEIVALYWYGIALRREENS